MTKLKSHSDKLNLSVKKRSVFGKKLKKLRREGLIPANIYGPEFKSTSVSINVKDFIKIYRVAKETRVVYLNLDKEEIPILIKNLQRHPVTDIVLHADFRKIDLKKKIETNVPVKVMGASEAVNQKAGVLLTLTESLLIEALPENIPHEIVVDISSLKDIGQEVKVADLPKSDKYEVKDQPNKVVVSVVEHKEESVTPEITAAVAPEVITEKPAEGEIAVPAETGKPAGKKSEDAPATKTEAVKPVQTPKPAQPQKPATGKK